ncbi:MAG: hypothetical protein ACTSRA_12305 [Promethearchaeota archaeon]
MAIENKKVALVGARGANRVPQGVNAQVDDNNNLVPVDKYSPFEKDTNVVRQKAPDYNEDFVFGSPQLDDDGDADHDYRMFFDKDKGAFRAGIAESTTWDSSNRGTGSFAIGKNTTASGANSHAEGYLSVAFGEGSHAAGRVSNADLYASYAHASTRFSLGGDAQYKRVIVLGTTTDASETILYIKNNAVNKITLPTNHAYAFEVQIAAKRIETSMECAAYKIEGLIKNDGGSVTLVGSTVTTIAEDDSSWNVRADVDAVNQALSIKVTGAAGKTIHWVGTVHLTEVG